MSAADATGCVASPVSSAFAPLSSPPLLRAVAGADEADTIALTSYLTKKGLAQGGSSEDVRAEHAELLLAASGVGGGAAVNRV